MVASYLVQRLTAEYTLDHASASLGEPLYDIRTRQWITDWADEVAPGLQLTELRWATEPAGVLRPSAATETGLPAGIPISVGTIDAWAEATRVSVRRPGEAMLMYAQP